MRQHRPSQTPSRARTANYAEAILQVYFPEFSIDQRKQAVDLRLERQRILATGDSPHFSVVLDEAALRRTVGGTLVTRAQLEHVVERAKESTVTVQVIPFSAGAHLGMCSSFTILDFPDENTPGIVYVEEAIDQLYVEQADTVRRYRRIYANLRKSALNPEESVQLIRQASREL